MTSAENILLNNKHVLLCSNVETNDEHDINTSEDLDFIKKNFCGQVFTEITSFKSHKCLSDTILYLCGDIKSYFAEPDFANEYKIINIIQELSSHYDTEDGKTSTKTEETSTKTNNYNLINLGEVPLNIFNVGVLFRKFFDSEKDYFNLIETQHQFQSLTESNKQNNAYRTGIYLTKVEETETENENENEIENEKQTKFKLLRCSTNFTGPTDNFRDADNEIITKVNATGEYFFKEKTELNHVLAQIYNNQAVDETDETKTKETKAKIKQHSDKTKDMPKNAIMAFCTFYKDYSNDKFNDVELKSIKRSSLDKYDRFYKNASVLTKLRFRLKREVTSKDFEPKFEITLYPNSVFLMPLSTNRLYTHEIVPSNLSVKLIPTRMGYVIRCSNTDAVHQDDQTYIVKDGKHIKLEASTEETVKALKDLYFKENMTTEMVFYDDIHFSLNNGDYMKPII